MSRPIKKGLDYFAFDVDFFDDEKIMAISGEFGIKGEIVVIRLLCAIYRNGYFILWSDMLRFKLLKSMPGVSAELLDSIVTRLVSWGFFDKSLFDSSRVLTSIGIQKRYFAAIKRRQTPATLEFLLMDISCCGVYVDRKEVSAYKNPASCDVFVDKNTQSKVKERKKISPDGDTKKPPLPPPVSSRFLSLDELAEEAVKSQIWLDAMAKNLELAPEEVAALIHDKFVPHCIREGKKHSNLSDFQSHFNRWSARQKYSSTNNGTTANTGQHTDPNAARQRQFAEHIIAKLNYPDSPEPDVNGLY